MNTPSVAACVTGLMLSWRDWVHPAGNPGRDAPDIVKMRKIIDRSIEPGVVEVGIPEIISLLKKIDRNVQKISEQKSEGN